MAQQPLIKKNKSDSNALSYLQNRHRETGCQLENGFDPADVSPNVSPTEAMRLSLGELWLRICGACLILSAVAKKRVFDSRDATSTLVIC
jgi:hypothetical protein